jgi:hypothetical protein
MPIPKFTLYHFLVVFSTGLIGLPKAYYAYRGYSTVPNTMDWLSGVLVFLMWVVLVLFAGIGY